MAQPSSPDNKKVISTNRRASAKYEILETLEAGVMLTGPEVKSARAGEVNLQDGFVRIEKEQAYLWHVHIAPYAMGSRHIEQEPLRKRKLLLHRTEINRLMGKTMIKGLTVVPLEMYFNKKGIIKIRLGLARGKKAPDRRDDIKRRQLNREMSREFAGKMRLR